MMPSDVACVIVFYNPAPGAVETVRTLAGPACPVVVVVNQADPALVTTVSALPDVHVIQNPCNLGLATALNQGLGLAFDTLHVASVVALDQDSTPAASMPHDLARALADERADELANAAAVPVAGIGPMLVDRKSAHGRYTYDQPAENVRLPRTIPTSGTLLTRDAWQAVGPMLEPLFIDGIDHEWCFRAYDKGFRVAVSPQVTMLHDMGDAGIRVFGRFKPIHRSPIRHYFIVRNTLYLCSLGYVPTAWKISELLKTIRRFAVYLLVSTDRSRSLRLMCRAFRDGFSGRLGPCPIQ